jgi:hypothetical protein
MGFVTCWFFVLKVLKPELYEALLGGGCCGAGFICAGVGASPSEEFCCKDEEDLENCLKNGELFIT